MGSYHVSRFVLITLNPKYMEIDNKYDQSFRRSEIGVKKYNEEEEEKFRKLEREHLEKLADKFGGGRWE